MQLTSTNSSIGLIYALKKILIYSLITNYLKILLTLKKYFDKKNLLRLFSTKKISPLFYGSFVTILSKINNSDHSEGLKDKNI